MATTDFKELEWVREIFRSYNHPWFFCGGLAIDLFLDHKTREHNDIEIGIFREHQNAIQLHLKNWSLSWLENGNKNEWKNEVYLDSPIHEILAESGPSKLEILLNNKADDNWIYRRNPEITLPLERLILIKGNTPFLCPEVALLYKSKNIRSKDQQDFENALSYLSTLQKKWLRESLTITYKVHSWIEYL